MNVVDITIRHKVGGATGRLTISSLVMPDMAAPAITRASRFLASMSSS
jgi:hypothetical protein